MPQLLSEECYFNPGGSGNFPAESLHLRVREAVENDLKTDTAINPFGVK